ncbi:hypothetical protein LB456_03075 [Psychroflexus sp. CAK57W]|uniref:hypothetical protein n=1 Tax=Psychroflexus curvus TaxID=2873595 RepID=UPI001CD0056A|nr:hypothetical protein [Psychroflexus curvus]MBZ9786429.1 hypothetical protein [Psychroflexus curvus]
MAVLGRIIKDTESSINVRQGDVVCDVVIEPLWMQLRTYAAGDVNRERGSKQNIQFDKQKAKELRDLLDEFIDG